MFGSCLCGEVQFELSCKAKDLYQCHCSICRKITGSSASTTVVVTGNYFQWLAGEDKAIMYIHTNGRRVVFCPKCSSSLPDPNPNKSLYSIPAGLLQEHENMEVKAHIFVGHKAHWNIVSGDGVQFNDHFPSK